MRYIDADSLIRAMSDYAFNESPWKKGDDTAVYDAITNCIEMVEQQPTILTGKFINSPVKPVLKNKNDLVFIEKENLSPVIKKEKWQVWTCPSCGGTVGERYNVTDGKWHHDQKKCNYCPNCGQKILWEAESNIIKDILERMKR